MVPSDRDSWCPAKPARVMTLQDAVFHSALQEIQRQQKVCCESMDKFRNQHKEWQDSLGVLLAQMTSFEADAAVQSEDASIQLRAVSPTPSSNATGLEHRSHSLPLNKLTDHQHDNGHLPSLVEEVMMDQECKGDPQSWWAQRRRLLTQFVDSTLFEYITGTIIFANIVIIGIEADMTLKSGEPSWSQQVEQTFLVVYTLELILRVLGGNAEIFQSCWFLMDFFLVCVSVIAIVVAPIMTGGGSGMDGFEKLLVVRGLRLLRLARVLRMVGRFKVVWRLVSGLLTAWDTMLSATVLIILWLFIFACIAVEIISSDPDLLQDSDTGPIVVNHFGTLMQAILTLGQFVTLDSIAAVYYPLIMVRPWLLMYFLPVMVLISVGLMNLVTAVLVEHALSHASREEELARQRTKDKIKTALPELLNIFQSLDADGSGQVTRSEAANVPLSVLPPKVLQTVSVESMEDLFDLLDVDQGGTLSQAEFLEGLLNLLLLDVPIWAIQALKLLRPMRQRLIDMARDINDIKHGLDVIET